MRKLRLLLPLVVIAVALVAVPVASAASDSRSGATPLFYGYPQTANASSFGIETGEPQSDPGGPVGCTAIPGGKMHNTAWYRLVGTGGNIDLSTVGSNYDTLIAVYKVGAATADVCDDDSGGSSTSKITNFLTTAHQVYEVQVGLYYGNICPVAGCQLHLAATNDQAPVNDQRANATALTSSAMPSNAFASEEPGEQVTCPNQGPAHNVLRSYQKTIWYRFHAPATGTATFRAGGGTDTVAAVYKGSSQTYLGCNDDDGTGTLTSRVQVPVTGGTDYFLQVGVCCFGTAGTFAVSVDFTPSHDIDGDGFTGSAFGGPDCNDGNAAIHPGAVDIPHDGIDQNCDGHDANFPALSIHAQMTVVFFRTYTKVTKLPVSGAPKGAKIVLKCSSKKRGCGKFKSKTLTVKSTKAVQLARYLKKLKLKKNAKITVAVSKAGSIGTFTTFTIKIRKNPSKRTQCLEPGKTKPQKTCS